MAFFDFLKPRELTKGYTPPSVLMGTLKNLPSEIKRTIEEGTWMPAPIKKVVDFVLPPPASIKDLMVRSLPIGGMEDIRKTLAKKIVQIIGEEAGKIGKQTSPAISRLVETIKLAKPLREGAEKLYTQERALRAFKGTKALKFGGEAGYFKALGTLKGELPKPQFTGLRKDLISADIDELFTSIQNNPISDFYEKINTSNGLAKILDGIIPTEGELKLLQQNFGDNLVKEILKKRPIGEKIWEGVGNVVNIPRALVSSFDMSAPLRQGLVISAYRPKTAIKAGGSMIKYFFSPKSYEAFMENVVKRPTYQLMKDSGLSLTDISGKAVALSSKEEGFMSNFAAKIPILGKVVKASERAYTGFLNKVRADVFDDLTARFIERGITPNDSPQTFKSLAEFINAASGRGNLGATLNRATPIMNSVFFSPRLMASRINMLNPVWYFKLPAPVRKEAAKAFVKLVGSGIGVLSLAELAGAEVEKDPRSSDFGKIKVGNTRWDVWGGFQQWVRVTAQMILGETKSSTTGTIRKLDKKTFPFESRLDRAMSFLFGKLAPGPSLLADLLRGQNMVGEQMDISEKVIPYYLQDISDAVKDIGWSAAISVGIPGFFGVGTQTYKPQKNQDIGTFDFLR